MSTNQELVFQPFISLEKFTTIMLNLKLNGNIKIAVALSGGSDSMCLLLLLHKWAQISGASIIALIVNHQLRENINEEIKQVCEWVSNYNITIHILCINKINPAHKLQQKAREERYKVLLDFCKNNNIFFLAVAHNFNDLIETVNMREKRTETLWGLSGMSMVKNFKEVLVFRPLLFFTKEAIKATLSNMKQKWVEDPSNENIKFERVKERKNLGYLSNVLLDKYYCNINKYRESRIQLERESLIFLTRYCTISNLGVTTISLEEFLNLNYTIQVAVLRILIQFCSSKSYMVKINKVKNLINSLNQATILDFKKKFTLGGTLLFISNTNKTKYNNKCIKKNSNLYLNFVKESKNIQYHIYELNKLKNNKLFWDNRFLIQNVQEYDKNYFFAKLNSNEYNVLCKNKKFKDILTINGLNKEILLSLPWLFNKNTPCDSWILKLLDFNYVKFYPTKCLYKDLFYNFTIAKQFQ